MRVFAVAGFFLGFLGVCGGLARSQTPDSPQAPAQAEQAPPPRDTDKKVITIPAGTRIGSWLTNPINSKFARRGDSVRAVTAFPVSASGQMAIPTGTYVEGELQKVTKRGPSGPAGLQIRFTRMIFQSGYAVELDGATAQARVASPDVGRVPNGYLP